MFGKRRLTVITYILGAAVFLLTVTGDGSVILQYSRKGEPEIEKNYLPEITSVRTERVLMEETSWETVLYKATSPNEGPTVMVIGGIHGDEPAGYLAAGKIATWAIDRGTLLVLPRANVPAIKKGERSGPDGSDLNRAFRGDPGDNKTGMMASQILDIMYEFEPDWVIDLHEADHFERDYRGALGQTFIYPHGSESIDFTEELLKGVNRSIYNQEYYFTILRGMAKGSTIEAAQLIGLDALIIETTKEMDIDDRIQFHCQVVSSLFYLLEVNVY